MKAIFYIEAPFQLLSAYEAISYFSIKKYKILIRFSGIESNDMQLIKLIDLLNINNNNLEYVTINVQNRNFLDYLKSFLLILSGYIHQYKYKYIFIGNLDSKILKQVVKLVKQEKIILLDDGIKSIIFQKSFTKKYNFNLFTMLTDLKAIGAQKVDYNNFNQIKKMSTSIEYSNDVLFIGSKLSEIGIVTEEYYLKYIKRIAHYYSDSNILYITHRGESKEKLIKIKSINNIEIVSLDYPLELYPLYNHTLPLNIASFYSAALISLLKLYPKTDVKSFFIKNPLCYKREVTEAYNYIEKYIEVYTLDV